MANYMTTSLEATKYLCGLIRDLATVSEGIDDINLRSDGTFSSVMIDTLIKKCLEDSNEYTEKLVANLSRLELKLVTSESEITESNILYLFKPDGATSYNQYVVIEGNKVLLGTCDINMADYIKAADVAKDYATKVELKAVTDKIGTTTLTTTDTTITGAIEEVKRIAEGKAESFTFNSDDFSVDTATSAVKLTPERRVYQGTKADWDLLSVAEKTQYGATAFTDDEGGDFPLTSEAIQLISGVDANLARVIRYGKLVIIALDNLTATSSISEYTTLASGLPAPYTGALKAGQQVASGRITSSTYLYVSTVGTLSVGVGGWDGSRGDGSIVYVTND